MKPFPLPIVALFASTIIHAAVGGALLWSTSAAGPKSGTRFLPVLWAEIAPDVSAPPGDLLPEIACRSGHPAGCRTRGEDDATTLGGITKREPGDILAKESIEAGPMRELGALDATPAIAAPEFPDDPSPDVARFTLPQGQPLSASVAAGDQGLFDRYLRQVRAMIESHQYYPWNARVRRWEGTVTIAFELSREGQALDVHVIHSSGFEPLDSAAVDAVRKISRFPDIPAEMDRSAMALVVPMVYRLLE